MEGRGAIKCCNVQVCSVANQLLYQSHMTSLSRNVYCRLPLVSDGVNVTRWLNKGENGGKCDLETPPTENVVTKIPTTKTGGSSVSIKPKNQFHIRTSCLLHKEELSHVHFMQYSCGGQQAGAESLWLLLSQSPLLLYVAMENYMRCHESNAVCIIVDGCHMKWCVMILFLQVNMPWVVT